MPQTIAEQPNQEDNEEKFDASVKVKKAVTVDPRVSEQDFNNRDTSTERSPPASSRHGEEGAGDKQDFSSISPNNIGFGRRNTNTSAEPAGKRGINTSAAMHDRKATITGSSFYDQTMKNQKI